MSEALDEFGDVSSRPGPIVLAPAALDRGAGARRAVHAGSDRRPPTARTTPRASPIPLGELLLEVAMPADDPRRAIGPATQALADVLHRRVETIILGHDAGVRAAAEPSIGGMSREVRLAVVPAAAVAPDEPDDAIVDGVLRVVHRAVRPAPHPRPHARAADRAVGRRRGRRGRAADGGGPGRARAARRGHDGLRPGAARPRRVRRRRVVGGPGPDRGPRPRRRPPAIRSQPVRARSCPAAGHARGDPRSSRNGSRSWATSPTTCWRRWAAS